VNGRQREHHAIEVVEGCEVTIEAHGLFWTAAIADLIDAGVENPVDLECPWCGLRVLSGAGDVTFTYAVCVQGEHSALPSPSAN
jgi:hypothetical protein